MQFPLSTAVITAVLAVVPAMAWQSSVVGIDGSGHLSYTRDAEGNSIADFSWAGYKYGAEEPPRVPVVATLDPTSGDQTTRIQTAIAQVAAMTPDADGIRGALLLTKGTWDIAGTIYDTASGVILRGEGSGVDGTVLHATGDSATQPCVIAAGGRGSDIYYGKGKTTDSLLITDDTVYVGSRGFHLADVSSLSVGDTVVIFHPCTQNWINAVHGGDTIVPWTVGQVPLCYLRHITAISGDSVTVDAPIYNTLVRNLSQSFVYRFTRKGLKTKIGIENLRIDIETPEGNDTDENHAKQAIDMKGVDNSWVRGCTMLHFVQSGVILSGATRVTVDSCESLNPISIITGERRYNFNCYTGSQMILFKNCFSRHSRHAFVSNGVGYVSDMVVLNCRSDSAHTSSEGHRYWTTGMLFDNYTYDAGYYPSDGRILGFYNRSGMGTQHGWGSAHSVAWNCRFPVDKARITVMKPPTAQNWAIGCFALSTDNTGVSTKGPSGYAEGTNTEGLEPASLYAAQLADRLNSSTAVIPSHVASSIKLPALTYTNSILSYTGIHAGRLTIVTSSGRTIRSMQITPEISAIRLDHLASGIYIARQQTADAVVSTRFVIAE